MSISQHVFELIVNGDKGIAEARRFSKAWQDALRVSSQKGLGPGADAAIAKQDNALKSLNSTLTSMAGGLGLYLGTRQLIQFTREARGAGGGAGPAREAHPQHPRTAPLPTAGRLPTRKRPRVQMVPL